MKLEKSSSVYPLKTIEQNAIFYGINGFTLLGIHGPDQWDSHDTFLAINRHELDADGVTKAVAYAKAYLIDAAAHAITDYMLTDAAKEILCIKNFPEYLQGPYVKTEASHARTLEEYGWRAQDVGYAETLNHHFATIPLEQKERLLASHQEEIAEALADRVISRLGDTDPPGDKDALREQILKYLGKVEMHDGISMYLNNEAIPAVEVEVKKLLLHHLNNIEQNPERFADDARAFLEHPVAIAEHASFQHFPPKGSALKNSAAASGQVERGRRVWYAPWKRRTAEQASPDTPGSNSYERPLIDPARPGPDMAPILARVDEVLTKDFTPQMLALVLDQGAQIMVTGEKTNANGNPRGMYSNDSHSDQYHKIVHLWHNVNHPYTKDAPLCTENKKVFQEEFLHYACAHPAINLKDEQLIKRWLEAFKTDLGGYGADYQLDWPDAGDDAAQQKTARNMIRSQCVGRCSFSWDRHNFGRDEGMIFEASAEIFVCEKGGVSSGELRQKLPHLYPLYQELMQRLNHEGQQIIDHNSDIARWANESTLAHLSADTHAAQQGRTSRIIVR